MATITSAENLSGTIKVLTDDSRVSPLGCNHSGGRLYNAGTLWINLAKQSRWTDSNNADLTGSDVSALGFPANVPGGATGIRLYLESTSGLDITGTYTFRWKSTVDLTWTGGGGITVSASSWDGLNGTATLTFGAGITYYLSLTMTGSLGGLEEVEILDNAVLANGQTGVQLWDSGQHWHPDYLAMWRWENAKGQALRPFMARLNDLVGGNAVQNKAAGWALHDTGDFVTLEHSDWTIFAPPEIFVEFAQIIRPYSMWYTIPVNTTSAWRRELMAILKTSAPNTRIVFQYVNEMWNFSYSTTKRALANGIVYFTDQGASANFKALNVSVVSGSKDITLETGDGASITVGGPVVLNDSSQQNKALSKSVDTITLESNHTLATGTYTVYFGQWTDSIDWQMRQLEMIRQDCEAVFDNPSHYATVFGVQTAGSFNARYFTTPTWAEVEPGRTSPIGRHDAVALTCYYGYTGVLTTDMADNFGADEDGVIASFHAACQATLDTQAGIWGPFIAAGKVLDPAIEFWSYEGGRHVLHSAAVGGWTTDQKNAAVDLEVAYRSDARSVTNCGKWWQAIIDAGFDSACGNFAIASRPNVNGFWGIYATPGQDADLFGAAMLGHGADTLKAQMGGTLT